MTATLDPPTDRPADPMSAADAPDAHLSGPTAPAAPTAGDRARGGVAAVLAGLSGAAALVHLALTPAHVAEWPTEGRAFAVLAVAQLAVALAVAVRPTREALAAAVAVHVVPVAGWVWSRTAGFPFGPTPDVAEEVGWLDALTAGAEVLAVLLAVGLLAATRSARPEVPSDGRVALTRPVRLGPPGRGAVGLAALVIVGAAALVASPLGQHSHGDGAEAGHDHAAGAPVEDATLDAPLPPAVQDALTAQLTEAREVALRLPTVADAEAAGLLQTGNFFPGSAAHYVDIERGMATDFDLQRPLAWLYSGTDPGSRLVGVMYYAATEAMPEGFAGPLDTWHQHTGTCYQLDVEGAITLPFSPDAGVTRAQCEAVEGAEYIDQTGWMVHTWVVPGWDSPLGVFSHDNPNILCADGRAKVDDIAKGCVGT